MNSKLFSYTTGLICELVLTTSGCYYSFFPLSIFLQFASEQLCFTRICEFCFYFVSMSLQEWVYILASILTLQLYNVICDNEISDFFKHSHFKYFLFNLLC